MVVRDLTLALSPVRQRHHASWRTISPKYRLRKGGFDEQHDDSEEDRHDTTRGFEWPVGNCDRGACHRLGFGGCAGSIENDICTLEGEP
jgi:hypothetical protein